MMMNAVVSEQSLPATGVGQEQLSPELWHACAGPLVTLPTVGTKVVYFLQGHLEQVAVSVSQNNVPSEFEASAQLGGLPGLPPQILCQLTNVNLHCDPDTENVYGQLTLQPLNSEEEVLLKYEDMVDDPPLLRPEPKSMFCKMLTASDTSTHGGFSVPRKPAETCLPPLDYSCDPPTQTLVVRDLSGKLWNFRHIYRGNPKRHLLTTGWTNFISNKRLKPGDLVMFVRTSNGELRVACRKRKKSMKVVLPSPVISLGSMKLGVMVAAAQALATKRPFTVNYSPRTSASPFIIPLSKIKSAINAFNYTPGMRFKMSFETEEASSQRYRGTITAVNHVNRGLMYSLWRSIHVRWDEAVAGDRQNCISLWDIEPISNASPVFAIVKGSKHPRDREDLYRDSPGPHSRPRKLNKAQQTAFNDSPKFDRGSLKSELTTELLDSAEGCLGASSMKSVVNSAAEASSEKAGAVQSSTQVTEEGASTKNLIQYLSSKEDELSSRVMIGSREFDQSVMQAAKFKDYSRALNAIQVHSAFTKRDSSINSAEISSVMPSSNWKCCHTSGRMHSDASTTSENLLLQSHDFSNLTLNHGCSSLESGALRSPEAPKTNTMLGLRCAPSCQEAADQFVLFGVLVSKKDGNQKSNGHLPMTYKCNLDQIS